MQIVDIEQGTLEWMALRRNRVTGTKLADVLGTSLARVSLIAELISEAGTEQSALTKPTAEMERGSAEEEFGLKMFEQRTGKKIERHGAWLSSEYNYLMCSPDGAIKDKNGKYTEAVEIKSPHSKTAIFYKLVNMIPLEELELSKSKVNICGVSPDYIWQVVNYFLVNKDLQVLHFGIYDARFIDEEAKLYLVEVKREDPVLQALIKQAEEALKVFRADWLKWRAIVLPDNF